MSCGGFATEDDAKAARDEARVNARRGEYIDRNAITVAAYLDRWIEAHAVEVKPKTLQDPRVQHGLPSSTAIATAS
jgi:integrase